MKKEDILKICYNYSNDKHMVVAMEECSELIKAISKLYRYGARSQMKANLIEEMADVLVCFEILKVMYDIPDELLNLVITTKMKRNIERIDKE